MKLNTPQYFIYLLLSGLLLCTHASAENQAGNVVYAFGATQARDINNNFRSLGRQDPVHLGDTLITGEGKLQVRLSDKGRLALYPNSKVKVDQYIFLKNDKSKDRSVFRLLQGAVRAVTGLIGKRSNRKRYEFRTPVATIGIRGTAFILRLCAGDCFDENGKPLPDGLYVTNGEGRIIIRNAAGSLILAATQSAFIASAEQLPVQIQEPINIGTMAWSTQESYDFDLETGETVDRVLRVVSNAQELQTILSTNGLGSVGEPTDFPVTGNLAVKYAFNVADPDINGPASGLLGGFSLDDNPGNQISITNGELRGFTEIVAGRIGPETRVFDAGTASLGNNGFNSQYNVNWGTWDSNWQFSNNGNNVQGTDAFHYIFSDNLTVNLPTEGIGIYGDGSGNLLPPLGGTNPTLAFSGGNLQGNHSIFMEMNFQTGEVFVFDIQGNFPDGSTFFANLDNQANTVMISDGFANLIGGCNSGNACADVTISGQTFFQLLGANADAVIGSYTLSGSPGTIAISGTYLLD